MCGMNRQQGGGMATFWQRFITNHPKFLKRHPNFLSNHPRLAASVNGAPTPAPAPVLGGVPALPRPRLQGLPGFTGELPHPIGTLNPAAPVATAPMLPSLGGIMAANAPRPRAPGVVPRPGGLPGGIY